MTRVMMMQQEEYTMNSLINISGKLPVGLVEMYQVLEKCAKALDIEFLIIGAMARDVDFAILDDN